MTTTTMTTTTQPPTPAPQKESLLGNLLRIIEAGTAAARLVPDVAVQAGAEIAAKLEQIVQAAFDAHQQATGQPLDLSKLQPIALVPDPDSGEAKGTQAGPTST